LKDTPYSGWRQALAPMKIQLYVRNGLYRLLDINYELATLAVLLPLLMFILAGAIELRSNTHLAVKTARLVPSVLGIVAYGLFAAPDFFPHFHGIGSHWSTFFSAIVASSVAFVPHLRRSSSILIAIGGLMLVFVCTFFADRIV
jgi:hypothetical protein